MNICRVLINGDAGVIVNNAYRLSKHRDIIRNWATGGVRWVLAAFWITRLLDVIVGEK